MAARWQADVNAFGNLYPLADDVRSANSLVVDLLLHVLLVACDGETNPEATRDWYKACSAANQSMSGEPSGLALPSQFWKASFATNSYRLSPRKSGVSSVRSCPSICCDSCDLERLLDVITEQTCQQLALITQNC